MSYIASSFQKDPFSKYVSLSIGFHIAVLLFFTVKTAFFPSEDIIIKNAIRVDIVDLPDKIEPPKAKAAPKPKPKAPAIAKPKKPKKPKKPDLKVIKNKQADAMARLKAMEALKKIQNEVTKAKKPADTPPPPKQFKGNVLSSGDSLKGLDRMQFNDYYSRLKQHVRESWNLPQWLASANLKLQLIVYIDERGNVTRKELIKSSGNAIFDETALGAVDSASPFPSPPDRLKSKVDLIGFVFNFPQ